jgi:hypothetical protein
LVGGEFRRDNYVRNLDLCHMANLEWNGFSHPSVGRLARLASDWRGVT